MLGISYLQYASTFHNSEATTKLSGYLVPSSGQEWDKLGIKQVKDIFPFVRGKDERERVRMFETERERERSVLRMIVE